MIDDAVGLIVKLVCEKAIEDLEIEVQDLEADSKDDWISLNGDSTGCSGAL